MNKKLKLRKKKNKIKEWYNSLNLVRYQKNKTKVNCLEYDIFKQ